LANGVRTLSKMICIFNFPCLFISLTLFAFKSYDGNDAFWRQAMVVKQSSSFSGKHWILSLQIYVRQTVPLTWKPGPGT